jgi:hypothetical protein
LRRLSLAPLYMLNSPKFFLRLLEIVLLLVVISGILFWVAFRLPQERITRSLAVYANAIPVLEDQGQFGANTSQQSIYYWTSAPINDVRRYYEGFLQPFLSSSDPYGNWLITAYNLDGSIPTANTNSVFLTHKSFCSHINNRECISVALADAGQPDLYHLAISSPSNFYRATVPTEFAALPLHGTLIVYSYWIDDL